MIPQITRIKVDLTLFERQMEQLMNQVNDLQNQLQVLHAGYSNLQLNYDNVCTERDSLKSKIKMLEENDKCNTNNKEFKGTVPEVST